MTDGTIDGDGAGWGPGGETKSSSTRGGSMDRETRPDIQAQALCRELRQEGYLVPYPVLVKAMQAAAHRHEAHDGVAEAAKLLLSQAPEGSAFGERWRHASNLLWTHRHTTDKGGA